jgi:hypothetical protein
VSVAEIATYGLVGGVALWLALEGAAYYVKGPKKRKGFTQ